MILFAYLEIVFDIESNRLWTVPNITHLLTGVVGNMGYIGPEVQNVVRAADWRQHFGSRIQHTGNRIANKCFVIPLKYKGLPVYKWYKNYRNFHRPWWLIPTQIVRWRHRGDDIITVHWKHNVDKVVHHRVFNGLAVRASGLLDFLLYITLERKTFRG